MGSADSIRFSLVAYSVSGIISRHWFIPPTQCRNRNRQLSVGLLDFESTYLLALSSPRIALSPVVRELQQLRQDLKALDTDACSAWVQEDMLFAYKTAIDMFLTFMQDPAQADVPLGIDMWLQSATERLELYDISPTALMFDKDVWTLRNTQNNGDPVPAALTYVNNYWSLDAHTQCVQALAFTLAKEAASANTDGRYDSLALFDQSGDDPAPASPSDTAANCDDIPIVPDPKLVTVEYRVFLDDNAEATADMIRLTLPEGEELVERQVALPYAKTVELLTGHTASVFSVPEDLSMEQGINCEIRVNGEVVAVHDPAHYIKLASCSVVITSPIQ